MNLTNSSRGIMNFRRASTAPSGDKNKVRFEFANIENPSVQSFCEIHVSIRDLLSENEIKIKNLSP